MQQAVEKYPLSNDTIFKAKNIFTNFSKENLSNEETQQTPYLTQFFGDVLGYVWNTQEKSLWWESGSKVGGKCEWVVVSNFRKTRLYRFEYESKYHEFDLEELASNDEKIKEFHFLLAKDRLFSTISNQSPVHSLNSANTGSEIERRFYAHYSALREEVWYNLIELNKEKHYGRNFYLYKAQKLIDRIIFIRFCKENGALDNDAVMEALNNKWTAGKYNRMKILFSAMNEGNPEIGSSKFNGGLFAEDKDLDCLNISDDTIDKIVILYAHDFGSDTFLGIFLSNQ